MSAARLVLCMCKHLRRVQANAGGDAGRQFPSGEGGGGAKQYAQHPTVMPEQFLKAFYNTTPRLIQENKIPTKFYFFLFYFRKEGLLSENVPCVCVQVHTYTSSGTAVGISILFSPDRNINSQ